MTSLTNVPTKCRFAVLEVSEDEDDEKPHASGKAGSAKQADANSAGKTKKKKKKKRSRGKHNQSSEAVPQNEQDRPEGNEPNVDIEDWDEWMQKDEQFVINQFQKDLKDALEVSKRETTQARHLQEVKSSPDVATENSKEKKKKEKPVIMSLDEFVRSGGESVATSNTEGIYGSTKEQPVSALDEFMDWPDESLTVKGNSLDDWDHVPSSELQIIKEEKPPPSAGLSSKPSKKKTNSKLLVEARNKEQLTEPSSEKKLLTATREDQIQAEMVHIKDELDKTGHELIELRQAKIENTQTIQELKKELSQVKKRNKQLCFILSQAEMKEKSELLMQIEELNEVKEQVVQLHAELEQERSKNSALKSELGKASGRTRHVSSS